MTCTPFSRWRVAWKKDTQVKGQQPRHRPRVEVMEDRIVPSSFPATTNGIHIFEDQLPTGLSTALVQFLATHTDGTQKETLSTINQFRAVNANYTLLHYQLGTGNSPYDYILNNQWSSDFSYVNQQESWFAHQTYSGEPQAAADLASGRVGNSSGWDQADIANPAWQQYTLNQVFQNMASTGSNGWFADSFTYGISGGGYSNPVPTRYQGTNAANSAAWPGGITWTTQLGNWAQTIENAFQQQNATAGTNYQFIPNLDAFTTSWEPAWYDNANGVPIMDGAFLEGFGEATDTYDWTLSMNRGLNFSGNGKTVIMQSYPSASPSTAAGQQQVDFLLGTYLLLKGNETYLNIDYGSGAQYFPEYQLNLGTATTPLPNSVSSYLWNGVYRRNFQNGFVLVNPGSTTYTLNLGGTYQQVIAGGGGTLSDSQIDANGNYIGGSLTYQNESSVTLTGGSAAIFLDPINTSSSPTVQTPAQAAANPVTGTSVALSVLGQENGSDSGLTYTWSSTGPAGVSFSANGTNAAKNTTATFAQAGAYTFTATISDGSKSITSSVQVTVNPTLTSLQVKPASATVADGATLQLSATALDQFGMGLTTQRSFNWSIDTGGLGAVSSAGLYTAPATGVGSATVCALAGGLSGTARVTYIQPPTITAAGATPNSVTGKTTQLVAAATDPNGVGRLIFTWSLASGPAGVTFGSNNGSTSGNIVTALFAKAGSYTFQVTVTDSYLVSSTQTVMVTVQQTLTSVTVSPATASIRVKGTVQFKATALDQFGNPLAVQPSLAWILVSGPGTLSSSGLYTGTSTGTAVIKATVTGTGISGSGTVTERRR
jgi:hypothetical protein